MLIPLDCQSWKILNCSMASQRKDCLAMSWRRVNHCLRIESLRIESLMIVNSMTVNRKTVNSKSWASRGFVVGFDCCYRLTIPAG